MFQVHSQHIDLASGFHVIELRDERGVKHVVQIATGHDSCPACGAVYPKDNLGTIDPKAMISSVATGLNVSHGAQLAYAKKHNLKVK